MPTATINPDETFDYDLQTLPEGHVKLKRMSYGDWLTRQEMAIQIELSTKRGGGGEVTMASREVTIWEFKSCIVDHNLTDANDAPLDFRNPYTFNTLNPRVGNEIAKYIMELHDFENNLPN